MKKNNSHRHILWSMGIAILGGYLVMSVGASKAEVAVGSAQATVVAPVSVHITATPSLSQMNISVEEASQRATAGTPVLRISSAPPSSASASTSSSDTASPAITTAAATAEAASSAAVNVTVNSDGSLSVIGPGNGIAFTVTQPASNSVTIEYN